MGDILGSRMRRLLEGPKNKCAVEDCLYIARSLAPGSLCGSHSTRAARDRKKDAPPNLCMLEFCEGIAVPSGYCRQHQNDLRDRREFRESAPVRRVPDFGNKVIPAPGDPATKPCEAPYCPNSSRSTRRLCDRHAVTLSRLNLTVDAYLRLAGDGSCHSCGDKPYGTWNKYHVIDHDHACCPGTGYSCGKCVRGFLCGRCNTALGYALDSPDRLISLALYAEAYATSV